MEEFELSEKAKRQQAAIIESNKHLRAERLELEAKVKDLNALLRRKEQYLQRLEQFYARASASKLGLTLPNNCCPIRLA